MFDEQKGISPLLAAQNLTPWWMKRIKEFDAVEIKPCRIIGRSLQGQDITQPCPSEHASFWAVYGHYRPGSVWKGIESLDEFPTEAKAQKFYDQLLNVFPHLRGDDRPHAPHNNSPKKLTP